MKNFRNFNKKWKRKLSFFLVNFMLLSFVPLPSGLGGDVLKVGKQLLAADDKDYFLEQGDFLINLTTGTNTKELDLTSEASKVLSLKSKPKTGTGGSLSVNNATITFSAQGGKVGFATITGTPGNTSGIKVDKRGAGAEQIAGTIEIDEGGGKKNTYNFNFIVKADVKIHEEPIYATSTPNTAGFLGSKLFTTDQMEVHDLMLPVVNAKYSMKLKGYEPSYTYDDGFEWMMGTEGIDAGRVAHVTADGNVQAIGAGYANLEVIPKQNTDNKAKSDKTRILVPLKFYKDDISGTDYGSFTPIEKGAELSPKDAEGTSIKLFSNIYTLDDLEWEVTTKDGKKEINNKKISEFFKIEKLQEKSGSAPSAVRINIERAGEYKIKAKLKKMNENFSKLDYFDFDFVYKVPFIKKNLSQYMNVGDEFNIYNNSNIGDLKDYTFTVTKGHANIQMNQHTSVVTALKTGEAQIEVSKNGTADKFLVDLSIIDTLTLNQNSASIPVGGTLDLSAISTDTADASNWVWSSSVDSIASVEGKGNTAVVKGLKPGEVVISVAHTAGGITKKASCKVFVKAGVTSIKLVPTEEVVDVGKIVSIKAIVEPKVSQGTYLYWRSSNPKIVEIDDENEHSATNSVTAKAPGVAVIMALNKDNVVLGTCTIRVKQPVKQINLSTRVLERPIEDKTYQLTATVLPAEAGATGLVWTSTKPDIALVDANGLVTFKKPGSVTIICASESDPRVMDTCDINIVKGVAGLTIDKKEVVLSVGETYKLTAEVKPEDASNKNFVFTSLDSKVATITNSGLITAKAPGTAYIMVSTQDKKFNETCVVKVTQKPTGFKLSASSLVLDVGGIYTLEATFNPKTATETKIVWTSSDASVAKVDAKGRVIGAAAGKCIITATTGNGLIATCNVTVNQQVSSIAIDPTEAEIEIGEELELSVEFNSDDVTNKDVKWKSSNPDVAKIDKKGVVTGVRGGITVITVTSEENGMTATSIITVIEKVAGIKLNETSLYLAPKEKFTLIATVENKSATSKRMKWTSSNKKVVTVNSKGVLVAKKIGSATIKVEARDGSGAEATCKVRVVRPASSLSVDKSFLNMVVGKTKKLKVKIGPRNASIKTAKFKTEDPDIAIIDNKGKITALAAGKTKIITSTKDSSKLEQVTVVRVREYVPASGITLSSTNLTMGVGDKQSVIYSLSPNGADDKVTWSSNNKASVRVTKKGVITAVAPGASVVTATTSSGRSATIAVTVVGLNFYSLELEQYDSYLLSVLGDVKNVTWDSGNHSIATVSGGTVVAKKAGTCNIYARVNGALLTCRVRVKNIR